MQTLATSRPAAAAAADASPDGGAASREPDIALCDLIRARSVVLGERTYIEHARTVGALSFRQLERSMEQWRALLGGAHARGLTTIGLVISDPVAFADAFLGATSAGFWVAPLDPSMPVGGSGGLAVTLERTGVDVVLADHPAPAGIDGEWTELDRLEHLQDGRVTRPGATAPQRAGAGGVVLSSSGTTGTPKVVRLSQEQLLHTARSVASHLELQRRPRIQPAAALPHQRRGRGPVVGPGGRLQPGPRRPLPPQRLLGPHGQPFHHLDQRGARHRLAPGHARPRRDRSVDRPVHPLGVGPVTGGRGRPVRGEYRDPGH